MKTSAFSWMLYSYMKRAKEKNSFEHSSQAKDQKRKDTSESFRAENPTGKKSVWMLYGYRLTITLFCYLSAI
jgi:hypothetical protein